MMSDEEKKLQRIEDIKEKPLHAKRMQRMESHLMAIERKLGAFRGKKYALEQAMLKDIISKADVVRSN